VALDSIDRFAKAGNEKKSRPLSGRTQVPAQNANALPPAGGSHSAKQQVLRLKYGRGAGTSRSIFSLRNWAASWPRANLDPSPTRSAWRFHVPRIWIRSINGRKFSVKGKTQNVVDVSVLRLFVVVLILLNRFRFNAFRARTSHATLHASKSK